MIFSMKYYREDSFNRDGDPNYFCSLCEEEGRVMMTSSEIKMISHIQREHQDLHLVVNNGQGNPGSEGLREKLVENFDVNRDSDNNNITFSQDDTFYPCDHEDCSDIFLSSKALRNHKASHKEKEEAVHIKVKKNEKPSNIKVKIQNKHRDIRVVSEYKCPICPKVYLNTDNDKRKRSHGSFRNHVLSHFYKSFLPHLPSSRPYNCPICHVPHLHVVKHSLG